MESLRFDVDLCEMFDISNAIGPDKKHNLLFLHIIGREESVAIFAQSTPPSFVNLMCEKREAKLKCQEMARECPMANVAFCITHTRSICVMISLGSNEISSSAVA